MSKVQAQIISIGDELLLGETVNTNASYIARALHRIGVEVVKIWTIADVEEQMLETIHTASEEVSLVIMTGGLGPTNDDKTQKVLCDLTQDRLIENLEVLEELTIRYAERTKKDTWEINKKQAMVPSKAKIFVNDNGTAPALWMAYKEAICIAMPGVPFEMKALFKKQILPAIQDYFPTENIYYQTLLTYGIGESRLMLRLAEFEAALSKEVRLAYLPSNSQVRLRLLGIGADRSLLEEKINTYIKELQELLPDVAVGIEEETNLVKQIKKKMLKAKATLSLAESCTGGFLSRSITKEAGVSGFYSGGVVTYATQSKIDVLGVDPELIEKYSVVSAEVAAAMAEGVSKLFDSTYAIATTGEAGPVKGDSNAEIGTVFIALKTPKGIKVTKHQFGKLRKTVIKRATKAALTNLWKDF